MSEQGEPQQVFASWGLGVESTAALMEIIENPASRNFPLSALTVATAVVGSEYPDTIELAQTHVLPILARHRVRLIQISRTEKASRGRYTVLSDTDQPTVLHSEGPWRLVDEYLTTGTIPQLASRRCSHRAKSEILDMLAADLYGRSRFRHLIGYNVTERSRIDKDNEYATDQRVPYHPLDEWSWTREHASLHLEAQFGVEWPKSACHFCCYAFSAKNVDALAARWAKHPNAGAEAIYLEHVARTFNPKSLLFGTVAARDFALSRPDLADVLTLAEAKIAAGSWSVFELRRVYTANAEGGKGSAWRSVRVHDTGTRNHALTILSRRAGAARAALEVDEAGIHRAWLRRTGADFPTAEHFLTAAPAAVSAKERSGFAALWQSIVQPQLALF